MSKRPPPQPNNEAYVPLQEAIQQLAHTDTGRLRKSEALLFFTNSQKELGKLAHDLARAGMRRFAPLAVGTHAIALETTDGQIVRIEDHINAGHGQRAEVHEQLQAIQSGVVKREGHPYFCYEVLPKLDVNVSAEDTKQFKAHVTSKGYKLDHADHTEGNLGYLPDGTVVGVDKHALHVPASKEMIKADRAKWLVQARPGQQSVFAYVENGFISKQEKFFPAIADGRMRGVLTDNDIRHLGEGNFPTLKANKPECFTGITPDNLEEFVYLVKDQGWYPHQAQAIMRQLGSLVEETRKPPQGIKIGPGGNSGASGNIGLS